MPTLPPQVLLDDEPLDRPWIRGSRRGADPGPVLQVRRVDDATFVLRQSMRATWEAPFLYLLLGTRRALLLDTGNVADVEQMPLQPTVSALVDDWVARHALSDYRLVVAHSHGHRDHVRGDGQFAGREGITVVGVDQDSVRSSFGIDPWPGGVASFDLGDRELLVSGIPGHDARSIVVADPSRGLLLSGDTAYPGRLYVQDLRALQESLDRMLALAERAGAETILGGHIEFGADGGQHPVGTRLHEDERPLPLTVSDLRRLRELAHDAAGRSGVVRGEPMHLWIGPCRGPILRMVLATAARRVRGTG
ncbi:MBL fold metallo-hydrolase [Allobranchiibius huperziae]|uniref:Glyoxylase-like metal-dependent hydrolase (Beta-lactamase superfamily II) n=1 Tax=Allobranchiibius huperziae TaxID=1874116 RepID=A0A853DFH9_9MICO|nr:MBL fold metallo-hydrolase [Allobranchiibius huperziae]NYJ76262.1 glyoxylase-like metal-dependent hydrolase (beta-lactamase superfamily II) [Allobranchiibius huperziae]